MTGNVVVIITNDPYELEYATRRALGQDYGACSSLVIISSTLEVLLSNLPRTAYLYEDSHGDYPATYTPKEYLEELKAYKKTDLLGQMAFIVWEKKCDNQPYIAVRPQNALLGPRRFLIRISADNVLRHKTRASNPRWD